MSAFDPKRTLLLQSTYGILTRQIHVQIQSAMRPVPPRPGAVIRHEILTLMGVTQAELARAMGVSAVRLNLMINGKNGMTAGLAVRLAQVKSTSAEHWLTLQFNYNLFKAREGLAR